MIAAVEDARAAQERETARLRDKLVGLGVLQPTTSIAETNGNQVVANGTLKGCSGRGDGVEGCSDLVKKEEVRETIKLKQLDACVMSNWKLCGEMGGSMRYRVFRLISRMWWDATNSISGMPLSRWSSLSAMPFASAVAPPLSVFGAAVGT